jgi:hypothetical protein
MTQPLLAAEFERLRLQNEALKQRHSLLQQMCKMGQLAVQYLQALAGDAERDRLGSVDQAAATNTPAVPGAAALNSVIQELQEKLGSEAEVEPSVGEPTEDLLAAQQQKPGCTQEILSRWYCVLLLSAMLTLQLHARTDAHILLRGGCAQSAVRKAHQRHSYSYDYQAYKPCITSARLSTFSLASVKLLLRS